MTRIHSARIGGAVVTVLLSVALLSQPNAAIAQVEPDGAPDVAQQSPSSVLPEVGPPDAATIAPESRTAEAPVLPTVTWPNHGPENGLVHLTGAVFIEHADGTVRTSSYELRLMAKDQPGAPIATASLTPFSFYNLPTGREYYLVVSFGNQQVYVADVPSLFLEDAQSFTQTQYEITVVLPQLARATGTIGPTGLGGSRLLYVYALYFDAQRGRYRETAIGMTYTGSYEMWLYPGEYVFRGLVGAMPRQYSDEFYPDGDHFEDASPIMIDPGEVASGIDFVLDEAGWLVGRISGPDRYATSVEISRATFELGGIPVLYLASGANWPDALSAGPAAAVQGGGLLLTAPNSLPPATKAEIERLNPQRVVVVGSPASVSALVLSDVAESLPNTIVTRIGGVDRFETSRMIVEDAFGTGPYETVFIATGRNFPDALSAGPIAGRLGVPLLMVDGSAGVLDDPSRALVAQLQPAEAAVLGSETSISAGIEHDLAGGLAGSVRRFAGTDRFETNDWLNNVYVHAREPYVALSFFVNGYGFADALAGSTLAAAFGAPIYLSLPNCVNPGLLNSLDARDWDRIILLGGEPSLSAEVSRLETCW